MLLSCLLTIPLVGIMVAHVTTLVVLLACDYHFTEVKLAYSFVLWQGLPVVLVSLSLPILLLFQPHIRHKIKCRKSQRLINVCDYGTTVHKSHPSSYTHFSNPHEDRNNKLALELMSKLKFSYRIILLIQKNRIDA